MKKEHYRTPEMELSLFEAEDVITSSCGGHDDIAEDDTGCSHG